MDQDQITDSLIMEYATFNQHLIELGHENEGMLNKIEGLSPIKYAITHKIKLNGLDPVEWAAKTRPIVTINHKHPIVWAAEHNPPYKINGVEPLLWAAENKIRINNFSTAEAWAIKQNSKGKNYTIDGKEPIDYAIESKFSKDELKIINSQDLEVLKNKIKTEAKKEDVKERKIDELLTTGIQRIRRKNNLSKIEEIKSKLEGQTSATTSPTSGAQFHATKNNHTR